MTSGSVEIESASLGSYLKVLRERKWWIIATVALLLAAALVWSLVLAVPNYKSTAGILRQSTSFDKALFNTQLFELRDAQRELQTGSGLIKLDIVAQMVKDDLGSPRTTKSLLRHISVEPQLNTDIINIRASSADPKEAADIANSFARQFIAYRQAADRAALSRAKTQVDQQLASMTQAERDSERGTLLAQKSEELGILESMQTGGFEIVQPAQMAPFPSSPRPVRNAFLAVIGGLLFGILLAFVVDRLDRRIKTTDALEKEFGLPMLAGIPNVGHHLIPEGNARSDAPVGFSDPSPSFVESFRSLRSNLKYFEFDRQIRTIAVTSGLPREGKTVTTVNLAVSLALSGARVAVIEADLRRPMLHRYYRLSSSLGVSNILAGTHNLSRVMQRVRVDQQAPFPHQSVGDPSHSQRLERNLFCVTSGPLPPNPAELIGSQQMKTLIEEAAALADYVLIDTPPVLVVADALSLMSLVDAVIVCSRINSTTIEEARQVRTLLQRIGAHTLGVVAGGVKASKRRRYDTYGYFLSEQHIGQNPGDGIKSKGKREAAPAPMGRQGS